MIGRQTAMGGMMMVGMRMLTRLIDLATMLVLVRRLDPADFGLVAIAVSAVVIVESALELPLNQALVRLPVVTQAHFDTAFTLAVLRVAVLMAVILPGAAPFAHFYGDKRLFWLVCVLSLGAGARGLTSPRMAEYQKSMSFWRDVVVQLSGKMLGFVVSSVAAVLTGSYWSIAVGTLIAPLVAVVTTYWFAPYRPRFSLAELPTFGGFVGWMSAAQVLGALNWQAERLLLGKLQGTSGLGLFTTASDISMMPFLGLFGPLTQPLLAAFSLVRHDAARLRGSYQRVSGAVMALGLPLLVGESLIAEPAVRVVLGEAWLGAVPLLQWLALSLIPGLFALAAIPLVMSLGDTRIFLKRNALDFCVKMPILIVGAIWFGFAGVAVSRGVAEAAAALYCMHAVRRLTGLTIQAQILASWRSFVATLVMAPAVILTVRGLDAAPGDALGGLQGALDLMAMAGVGVATYGAAMWLLWLLSGRPRGVEAMAVGLMGAMVTRTRRAA
jgi:PST family polysaccharide transporter